VVKTPFCTNEQKFVKIGQTVADISQHFVIFKMAAVRHLGFVERVLGPPEDNLVVSILVQNLVEIDAVVSMV